MIMLDIMPEWRAPLKEIAYSPFTRVDVRRMRKLGVLAIHEVAPAYEDLGYKHDKALKMAEFTEKYNLDPEFSEETFSDREAQKNKDVSVSAILRGYNEFLLDRKETLTAIMGLGYSEAEVEWLLAFEDFKRAESGAKRILTKYRNGFVRGVYTRQEIEGKLGELNLPGKYTENLLTEWDEEKETRVSIPSKAEFVRFYKKKIISKMDLEEGFKRLGYEDKYIVWYLADLEKEVEKT